ncbi:DUF6232 family protein [Amycolatopsis sp. NPDC049691]|uniref:DUF6232 family protein n=1 Tax=Amycolatopsis sp. NPDC049691 TaxID=3155155 RepID=UPI00342E996D
MPHRNGDIEVKVSQQILWVGGEAYPLRNIARARVVRLTVRRGAAFGRFLGFTLLWLVLGMGATVALRAAKSQGVHLDRNLGDVVLVVTGVLIGLAVLRLLYLLVRPALFALVIETAGNPHTALITTDEEVVSQIVREIMAAINNPAARFKYTVNNIHNGDKYGGDHVSVSGSGIGKIVH